MLPLGVGLPLLLAVVLWKHPGRAASGYRYLLFVPARSSRSSGCRVPARCWTPKAPGRSPCGGSPGALGIKAPSLYKHVPDKTSLEALAVAAGFAEFAATVVAAAGHADDTGRLTAIAAAYRAYAVAHPHLYRLMNYQPLRRDLLPAGMSAAATGRGRRRAGRGYRAPPAAGSARRRPARAQASR